jgi:hypothetical protein
MMLAIISSVGTRTGLTIHTPPKSERSGQLDQKKKSNAIQGTRHSEEVDSWLRELPFLLLSLQYLMALRVAYEAVAVSVESPKQPQHFFNRVLVAYPLSTDLGYFTPKYSQGC